MCQWVLLRAARHVERLRLRVELDHQQLDAAAELETALVAMLVGCGAAGRLSELDLSLVHVPFGLSSWLSALRSLQKLQISAMASLQGLGAECRLVAAGPLHTLTDLEVLWLSGYPIVAMSDVRLPPSLTRLHLCCYRHSGLGSTLLHQVRTTRVFSITQMQSAFRRSRPVVAAAYGQPHVAPVCDAGHRAGKPAPPHDG